MTARPTASDRFPSQLGQPGRAFSFSWAESRRCHLDILWKRIEYTRSVGMIAGTFRYRYQWISAGKN